MTCGAGMTRQKERRAVRRLSAAELEIEKAKVARAKVAIIAAACPLSILALWPTMAALAGHDTDANLHLSFTVTITVSVAWAVTGELYRRSCQRNKQHATTNNELSRELVRLKSELRAAESRVKSVETDLANVRADADRLRRTLRPSPDS